MKAEELKPSSAGRAQHQVSIWQKGFCCFPKPSRYRTSAGPIPTTIPSAEFPADGAQLENPSVTWIKGRSDSLVDVGVGVVGENVVLSPEYLHSLLGIFLQLKYNQEKTVFKTVLLLLQKHRYP